MKLRKNIRNLSKALLDPFLVKSWRLSVWMVVVNYSLILTALMLPLLLPNLASYFISLIILANRQLGLAILMHDAAHNALFPDKRFNRFVGRWFFGAPILADLDLYRTYHLEHHKTAGSNKDPDRSNYIK